MASKPRIYIPQDEELVEAMEIAAVAGLTPADAAAPKKLRALVLYAQGRLTEEMERAETVAAYEELGAWVSNHR